MDLAKNKYGIAFLLIVAVAAIHYFFFYEKCEQPDKTTVYLIQLNCAYQVDIPAIRVEACQKLYGTAECEFQETDRPVVIEIFNKKVNDCALATLKKENKCVDKYEAI